ncbi:hypothetical protein [Corynebacterium pyruviciproducens]|uniref:hypothetical protein n=1 Tax=Corynebacterium pyruviciproducens TaxID=598660 RepID=UPI0023EFAAD7|nr:hypothetical protein [Corynebacterium pyruviciproducens]
MDKADCFVLVDCLRQVVRLAPRLDDLMVPTVPASGANAGVRARVGGSRLPLVVHPLDVKMALEPPIFGWSACLADDLGVPLRVPRRLDLRAAWMVRRRSELCAREWAPTALEELVGPVRMLRDAAEATPVEKLLKKHRIAH